MTEKPSMKLAQRLAKERGLRLVCVGNKSAEVWRGLYFSEWLAEFNGGGTSIAAMLCAALLAVPRDDPNALGMRKIRALLKGKP